MSRLWDLVSNRQRILPLELRDAVEEQLVNENLDYRTRLLIQESVQILRDNFGIEINCGDLSLEPGRRGFPNLEGKVGDITSPETIERYLRELGANLTETAEVSIGGSSALIMQGLLSRQTQDVDVVDEVPAALRSLRIRSGTGLYIAHFQSHYLPEGWHRRRKSRGDYKKLRVFLVDGLDIYVGKFFSVRQKDTIDLYHLQPHFQLETVREHLQAYGQKLAADPKLREAAEKNWYVAYNEDLPQLVSEGTP